MYNYVYIYIHRVFFCKFTLFIIIAIMINSYCYCKYYYYHYHYYFYCYYCYSCYYYIIAIIVVYIVAGSHQRSHQPNGTDSSVETYRSVASQVARPSPSWCPNSSARPAARILQHDWLVVDLPKNDGVRQLVLSFPTEWKVIKVMFQTKLVYVGIIIPN